MPQDDVNSNSEDAEKPDDTPKTAQATNDDQDDYLAQAGSEPGDTHPVFGNDVQPQEILDKDVIGTNDTEDEPFKGENASTNYDPENDSRMHDQPEE